LTLPEYLVESVAASDTASGRLAGEEHRRETPDELQSLERKLTGLLEQAVAEDPVIDLAAIEYPDEVKELRWLLGAGAYDVSRITPMLRAIREAPSSRTLKLFRC
jgi:hypothetical protein